MVTIHLETHFGGDRCTQFRVIVVTEPQANKPTNRQDRLQYTAPLSLTRSVINESQNYLQRLAHYIVTHARGRALHSDQIRVAVLSRLYAKVLLPYKCLYIFAMFTPVFFKHFIQVNRKKSKCLYLVYLEADLDCEHFYAVRTKISLSINTYVYLHQWLR